MCGIAGLIGRGVPRADALQKVAAMTRAIAHRGPDGTGTWAAEDGGVGFGHARLAVIDVSTGDQPMIAESGSVITYNGEIYNYLELRAELGADSFQTTSDTEVILRAYERWGDRCVDHLRGMFAFAIWDAAAQRLFVARDRFGIKPFYYTIRDGAFYFASEAKALLPAQADVQPDLEGVHDYFTFQFCLGDKTMFAGIKQLRPAFCGFVSGDGQLAARQYWEVQYQIDSSHDEPWFVERMREAFSDSVAMHLRSDVEVGSYVSGGVDSSLVAAVARETTPGSRLQAFTGRFDEPGFDESPFARELAAVRDLQLHESVVGEADFIANIAKVIYHLDQPTAGPGSFPQYMVSKLVRDHVKVVLGGQGGDEIFGGYARYLIAYWEQCIKGALDGTMNSGNFVVTYESIIPNLQSLRSYKPLIQEFWAEGFFDARDSRYFRLINRANTFGDVVNWNLFSQQGSFEEFRQVFWGKNVGKESFFDSMTHFDFKTLLPALLQVEDRMSMAHGVEARVPFLDHPLVELAATIPADIKFQGGELKRFLRVALGDKLPSLIRDRRDKMGFPVPLQKWMKNDGPVREFVLDVFRSDAARQRFYLSPDFDIEHLIEREGVFGRNLWALLSLELWQQQFFSAQQVEHV